MFVALWEAVVDGDLIMSKFERLFELVFFLKKKAMEPTTVSNTVSIQVIMSFVVKKCEYDRMIDQECEGCDLDMSYEDFLDWNAVCVNLLSSKERDVILGLCELIRNKKVRLMDLENCSTFGAHAIYFDKKKKLCIVNPR